MRHNLGFSKRQDRSAVVVFQQCDQSSCKITVIDTVFWRFDEVRIKAKSEPRAEQLPIVFAWATHEKTVRL